MEKKRFPLWPILIAIVVLVLVLYCFYQTWHVKAYSQYSAEKKDGTEWIFWGDVSNRWQALFALLFGALMAGFTYVLYLVALSQRELLKEANTTAAKAVNEAKEASAQTKRSVDVLIDIERGRVELDGMDLRLPTDEIVAAIVLRYANNGNTTATSIQRGTNVQFLGPTDRILDTPHFGAFTSVNERMPIPRDEKFGFGEPREILPSLLTAQAEAQIPAVMDGSLRLFIQGYIRYEVITGLVFWNWYTYVYSPQFLRFIPDAQCAFNGHGAEKDGHRPVVTGGTL